MADFVGMMVQVTLKDPHNTVLHGLVGGVIAGQTLTLQNVFSPTTGSHFPVYTVPGSAVADLQVVAPRNSFSQNPTARPAPAPAPAPAPTRSYSNYTAGDFEPTPLPVRPSSGQPQPPPTSTSTFVDPAILSFGRSLMQSPMEQYSAGAPSTPMRNMVSKAAGNLPITLSPFVGEPGGSTKPQALPSRPGKSFAQEGQPSGAKQNPGQIEADGALDMGLDNTEIKKKARNAHKKRQQPQPGHDLPSVMNVDVSRNGNDMDGSVKRGKGWRQTPLLQPTLQPPVSQQGRGARSKRRNGAAEQQNGWATEDATDIQDMGEFDFEANHKLFDKKTVFDQLRQGDTTADEDRLVSHNKVSRPGTHGGKNLHPTENVLSPKLAPQNNADELDSSSDADTELNLANGRSSSKQSSSRVPMKTQMSRQGSMQVEQRPSPLVTALPSERSLKVHRSMTSLTGKPGKGTSTATPSSYADRTRSPLSGTSATRHYAPENSSKAHMAIHSSNAPCPVLFPSALETLELETTSRYGLTQEAIIETSARCIAELALSLFDSAGEVRREPRSATSRTNSTLGLSSDSHNTPVVVILAGNHPIGARAAAAARHLCGRNTRIIVAEGRYDTPETHDVQLKMQTAILKRLQRTASGVKRGSWQKAFQYIRNLTGPPALIIDALLGGIPYDPQGSPEVREMIDWANRSRAPVLSLACPSGISGTDGTATVVEGEPLVVRPDAVLCFGTPLRGLLLAMKNGERWPDVRLADIGINLALRSEEAVQFGSDWVVRLDFVPDEVGEGV